jgi:hypothetical protein
MRKRFVISIYAAKFRTVPPIRPTKLMQVPTLTPTPQAPLRKRMQQLTDLIRVNVLVAERSGLSRRGADTAIAGRRVTTAGREVALGERLDALAPLELDGKTLTAKPRPSADSGDSLGGAEVFAWYKPVGVTTTHADPYATVTLPQALTPALGVERAEASPTAALLGRLSGALRLSVSTLLARAESDAGPARIARLDAQLLWTDPATGYRRRAVSPPGAEPELVEVELPPRARVSYTAASFAFLRGQLVWVLAGRLAVEEGTEEALLAAGDCLVFDLETPKGHAFRNPSRSRPCRYLVALSRR